jgi:clan AA aspartic protease (TIGR02281 family)
LGLPAALVLLILSVPARADSVFLKNGNEVKGLIVSQTKTEVEVDIGYGSVTLQRADIERIVRSPNARKEVQKRQFEAGLKVPAGAEKLNELYQAVKELRDKAHAAKSAGGDAQEKASDARGELDDLKERRAGVLRGLSAMNPERDPVRYNRAVDEVNDLATRILAAQAALAAEAPKRDEGSDRQGGYSEALGALEAYLASDEEIKLERAAKGWEADYHAWARAEAIRMRSEFRAESVRAERRGDHIIVTATINGRVDARLLVDTGASLTTLNPSIADALKLPASAAAGSAELTLADGRRQTAKTFRLDLLEVGNSKADGTLAAVSPTPMPGCDGLLGMSFLSRFQFRLDLANGRLVLETLK